jgi:hypothetical protein
MLLRVAFLPYVILEFKGHDFFMLRSFNGIYIFLTFHRSAETLHLFPIYIHAYLLCLNVFL